MAERLDCPPAAADTRPITRFGLRSLFVLTALISATLACFTWRPVLAAVASVVMIASAALSLFVSRRANSWKDLDTKLQSRMLRFATLAGCGAAAGAATAWLFVRLDYDRVDMHAAYCDGDLAVVAAAAAFGAFSISRFRDASPSVFGAVVGLCAGLASAVALSQLWFPANTYYANFGHFLYTLIACLLFAMIGTTVGIARFSCMRLNLARFRKMRFTSHDQTPWEEP